MQALERQLVSSVHIPTRSYRKLLLGSPAGVNPDPFKQLTSGRSSKVAKEANWKYRINNEKVMMHQSSIECYVEVS